MQKKPYEKKSANPYERKIVEKYYLYGKHPVICAVNNPDRKIFKILCTKNSLEFLKENTPEEIISNIPVEVKMPDKIENILNRRDKVTHQGIIAEVAPLKEKSIDDLRESKLLIFCDKVTDPHNIGAILRSCAAFGASALITQERYSPPENATIAKTSAGTIENIAYVRTKNIAKILEDLKYDGFKVFGLDGDAEKSIKNIEKSEKNILVVGSEGKGLSELIKKSCDEIFKIDMHEGVESLNASVATAIAVYEISK